MKKLLLTGLLVLLCVGTVSADTYSLPGTSDSESDYTGTTYWQGVRINPNDEVILKSANVFDHIESGTDTCYVYDNSQNSKLDEVTTGSDLADFNDPVLSKGVDYDIVCGEERSQTGISSGYPHSFSLVDYTNWVKGCGSASNPGSCSSTYTTAYTTNIWEVTVVKTNDVPQFNSSSISPDPPEISEDVNYSAEVFDSDGSIDHTNLKVFDDGSQVFNENRSGTTPNWDNISTNPTEGSWDARFETVDDAGDTNVTWLNRTLQDNAPTVTLNDPNNSTYFKYDVPLDFSLSDSDSNPGEDWNCQVDKDASQVASYYLKEGVNSSITDTVSSDLGAHNVTVSCTDNAGNTGTQTEYYRVKAFLIADNSTESPVYETENVSYNIDVKIGSMVEDLTTQLYWNETLESSKNQENGGITFKNFTHYFSPPLVQTNASSYPWKFEIEANITDFQASTYSTQSRNTTEGNQTIEWAYYDAAINNHRNRVIEKEDFNTTLSFSEKGDAAANETGYITFNGSTYTSFNQKLDPPLIESSNTQKTVTGTVSLKFQGSSRNITASNDTIDVYRKILTNCVDTVKGQTGDQALKFKLINEENQTQNLTGNIDYNFDTTHHGEHTRNYAFENNGVVTADLCLYPAWVDYNITGPLQYDSESAQNALGVTFPDRSYNLYNEQINNKSETLQLYLLKESLATPVYFSVVDSQGDLVPDVTIKVMRYFIGSNSYLTVAKTETDSEGVATTYMRVNEIYYKYLLTKEGDVLLETDRQILICQSTPCTKEFQIDPQIRSEFEETLAGFQHSCEVLEDNSGNDTGLQCTVSHSSDLMTNATLNVQKRATIGWEDVCSIDVTSSGETMVCQFNEDVDGNIYKYALIAWKDAEQFTLTSGLLDYGKGLFGENAEFAALMVFLTFTMLGLVSPGTSIAFSTVGIIFAWWLGLLTISIGAVASLVVVAAMVIAGGTR